MAKDRTESPYLHTRSRNAYFTALLSIGLTLFFLGLFAGLALLGGAYVRRAEAELELKVFVHDGVNERLLTEFEAMLRTQTFVQNLRFVSKEDAARAMLEETGEDVSVLLDGVNPLPASYNIRLFPAYIQADSLTRIRSLLEENLAVSEIVYPADRIARVQQNLDKIIWILSLVGVILCVVVFYIVFATIRLAIYARRMAIRSMQLMGATQGFIRRPFLLNGLLQGGLGAAVAVGLLLLLAGLLRSSLLPVSLADAPEGLEAPFIGLLSGIVLLGLVLGLAGSFFAVNRYLNRHPDELV